MDGLCQDFFTSIPGLRRDDDLIKCLGELKTWRDVHGQMYFYEVAKSWEDLVTAGGITRDEKLGPNTTLLEEVVTSIEGIVPAFRHSYSYQRTLTLSQSDMGKNGCLRQVSWPM